MRSLGIPAFIAANVNLMRFAEALDRGGSQARHDEHTFHWRVACPSGGRQRRDGHVGGAGGSSPCQMIHTTNSLLPATSTGFGSMRAIIV